MDDVKLTQLYSAEDMFQYFHFAARTIVDGLCNDISKIKDITWPQEFADQYLKDTTAEIRAKREETLTTVNDLYLISVGYAAWIDLYTGIPAADIYRLCLSIDKMKLNALYNGEAAIKKFSEFAENLASMGFKTAMIEQYLLKKEMQLAMGLNMDISDYEDTEQFARESNRLIQEAKESDDEYLIVQREKGSAIKNLNKFIKGIIKEYDMQDQPCIMKRTEIRQIANAVAVKAGLPIDQYECELSMIAGFPLVFAKSIEPSYERELKDAETKTSSPEIPWIIKRNAVSIKLQCGALIALCLNSDNMTAKDRAEAAAEFYKEIRDDDDYALDLDLIIAGCKKLLGKLSMDDEDIKFWNKELKEAEEISALAA